MMVPSSNTMKAQQQMYGYQQQPQWGNRGYHTIDPRSYQEQYRQYQQQYAQYMSQQYRANPAQQQQPQQQQQQLPATAHGTPHAKASAGTLPRQQSSSAATTTATSMAFPSAPNQGQYATLSRRCRTLEASSFY